MKFKVRASESVIKLDIDLNLDEVKAKVQSLIDANFPPPIIAGQLNGYNGIESFTTSYAVYSCNGDSWKVDYEIGAGGEVYLGARIAVKKAWAAEGQETKKKFSVVTSESMDVESYSRDDTKGDRWKIRIITSGRTLLPQQPLNDPAFDTLPASVRAKNAYRNYTAESCLLSIKDKVFENVPCVNRSNSEHLQFMQKASRGERLTKVNDEIKKVIGNIHTAEAKELHNGKVAIDALLDLGNNTAAKKFKKELIASESVEGGGKLGLSVTCVTECFLDENTLDAQYPVLDVARICEVFSVDPCDEGNAGGHFINAAEAKNKTNKKQKMKTLTEKQQKAYMFAIAAAAEAIDGGESADSATTSLPDDWGTWAAQYIMDNFPNASAIWDSADDIIALPVPKQIALFTSAMGAADPDEAAEDAVPKAEGTSAAAAEAKRKREVAAAESVAGTNTNKALEEVNALRRELSAERNLSFLETEISKTNFSDPMKEFVRNRFRSNASEAKKDDITGAIREAKNLFASMGHGDTFRGNESGVEVGVEESDRWKKNVMSFFFPRLSTSEAVRDEATKILGYNPQDKKFDAWSSLKDMFMSITGKKHLGFGFFSNASEAASVDILAQLATDALNVHMLSVFRSLAKWDSWKKIAKSVPANDFRNIHAQQYGHFAVGMGIPSTKTTPYSELDLKGNEETVYKIIRRGNLFGIAFEDVVNDNVGFVQSIPFMLARMAKRDVYKTVFKLLNNAFTNDATGQFVGDDPNNAGTPATDAFFSNTWGNKGTDVLSSAAVVAARGKMLQYKEIGSGEPMEAVPKYLIHQVRDFDTARQITNPAQGQFNETPSTVQSLGLEPLEIPFFNDNVQQRWWLAADMIEAGSAGIEVAFLYGKEEPTIIPEAAGTGRNFDTDLMQWKIAYHWGAKRVNPRLFFGSIVS